MASTAAAAASASPPPAMAPAASPAPPAAAAASKPAQKPTGSSKVLDASRKQTAASADSLQRRSSQGQKAWTSGTNPLTQRPVSSSRQNGSVTPSKSAPDAKSNNGASTRDSTASDKSGGEKLSFLLANCVGCDAKITLQGGEQFTGIFSAESMDSQHYVLKMTKRVTSPTSEGVNGASEPSSEYMGQGEDHAMAFERKDVCDFYVANLTAGKLQTLAANGPSTGFKTDTDISGRLNMRERELKQWEPSFDGNPGPNLSLQGSGNTSWNQFATNERLFGVKSDYDENIYTTTLDRTQPGYAERAAAADKRANEIMASGTTNAHVAEERGLTIDDGTEQDEESRYSGVSRDLNPASVSQGNKYTPPARRAPTGQATVPGAPVDPAIISSQLVRPESSSKPARDSVTQKPLETAAPSSATAPAEQHADATDSSAERSTAEAATPNGGVAATEEPPTVSTASAASIPGSSSTATANATANVETEVVVAYKNWAASEKLKYQTQKILAAKREKELKLNDLRKFSTNFKLTTPVPQDLVSILAKDKHKQEEIVEKAQRRLESQASPVKSSPNSSEQSTQKPAGTSQVENAQNTQGDRATARTARPTASGFNTVGPRPDRSSQNSNMGTAGKGSFAARITATYSQHTRDKNINVGTSSQAPIPVNGMPPTGPAAINPELAMSRGLSGQSSPSPVKRFNAKAMEFRPNPVASSFTPVGGQAVGKSDGAVKSTKALTTRPSFLEGKPSRPASERPSIEDSFNPIPRMKREAEAEKKSDYTSNGGIPQAYRTPPTWEVPAENTDKGFRDMFPKLPIPIPSRPASHTSPANVPLAHQHQLPPHLQQPAYSLPQQIPTPQGTPRHHSLQPHHPQPGPQSFDENSMRFSASHNPAYSSPRMQQPMMYNPMFAQGPPVPFGQPMPQYNMNQNQQMLQMRIPAGQQFVGPQGQQMGAPMMMSPSNGVMGIPGQPQMQMYSPGQHHVFPSTVTPMHAQHSMPGAYGSPRPGAPMMVQQGSQQGQMASQYFMGPGQQNGMMFAQQHPNQMGQMRGGPMPMNQQQVYGVSPNLQQHFPVQQHRQNSFNGYPNQMTPNQPMHLQNQGSTDDPSRNGP